jgi:hypothetical protein
LSILFSARGALPLELSAASVAAYVQFKRESLVVSATRVGRVYWEPLARRYLATL